jgi:hypothetical protein
MVDFLTPGVLAGGMSLLGGAAGLLGGGRGGQSRQSTNSSTNWNQTQTNSPWTGIQQYFMGEPGGGGTPGILPEAARLYAGTGFTPQMADASANWFNDTSNNRNIFRNADFQNTGAFMNMGLFDPSITAAGPISMPEPARPRTLVTARQGQGDLDPTSALKGFLTGEATSPWIDKQQQSAIDQLTRNVKENVMPGIRHNAIADGQYGGSRGDMAEGLALSRLNQDIAPALFNLAGTTWENEQNRKFGVANALNQQAYDYDQAEENRKNATLLDTQKFNTQTQLANNQQEMQRAAQDVANRMSGLNFASGAQGLTDQYYTDLLKSLNLPVDYDWSNLGRYSSIVSPIAGQYQTTNGAGTSNSTGVTTGSQQMNANPVSGLLSGAQSGLALFNGLKKAGLFG